MDTSNKKWKSDPAFIKLCDIVDQDNLICLTGAGISKGLKLKKGGCAPNWKNLLASIKDKIISKLSSEEMKDLNDLLSDAASGEHLIEAASILYAKDEKLFLDTLFDSVNLETGETSLTHQRLLQLFPRGILTYNYDEAHENAINQGDNINDWKIILPVENNKIIQIIKNNFDKPFLFKLHGSVTDKTSMVLTRESYRDLLTKYPYYKAFVQQIFTNQQLLILGFGLSDPDFEMLLQDVFSTFGSPIQEHIVIKHENEKSSKDIIYKLRYGLHFLYIEDFSDIPDILEECIITPGNIVNNLINSCTNSDITIRSKAHRDVRKLGKIGQMCLAHNLEEYIKNNIAKEQEENYSLNEQTSEYVYTYGIIAHTTREINYKMFLIDEVINKSIYSEPVAHALVHLRDILTNDDLSLVESLLKKFNEKELREDPNNPDSNNRISIYCESILYLLKAKYKL